MQSLPTFQLALFALYWGLHLVISLSAQLVLEVLMRLGEGLFDTQLTAQNYLTFLWHTTLPLGVLFELPAFGRFSDLDWALDTTVFNNLPTLRLLCPAGLGRRAKPLQTLSVTWP